MTGYSKKNRIKSIQERAFDEKKKPWLKFNPRFALTGLRTTGPRAVPLFRNGLAKSTLTFLQGPLSNSVIRRGPLVLRPVVAWQLGHFPTFLPLHPFQGTTREHWATALYAQFLDGLRGQTLPFFSWSSCGTTIRSPRRANPSTTASSFKTYTLEEASALFH